MIEIWSLKVNGTFRALQVWLQKCEPKHESKYGHHGSYFVVMVQQMVGVQFAIQERMFMVQRHIMLGRQSTDFRGAFRIGIPCSLNHSVIENTEDMVQARMRIRKHRDLGTKKSSEHCILMTRTASKLYSKCMTTQSCCVTGNI